MSKQHIETSGLTLAKGTQLKGDDFFEVKVMENITVAVIEGDRLYGIHIPSLQRWNQKKWRDGTRVRWNVLLA